MMLEAGRERLDGRQGKWRVRDIAELVAENLEVTLEDETTANRATKQQ